MHHAAKGMNTPTAILPQSTKLELPASQFAFHFATPKTNREISAILQSHNMLSSR
jgi:hypothetical protein